jgi:hypothetical protein
MNPGIGRWPHLDVLDSEPQRFSIHEIGAYRAHARGYGGTGDRDRGGYKGEKTQVADDDCPIRTAFIDDLLARRRA